MISLSKFNLRYLFTALILLVGAAVFANDTGAHSETQADAKEKKFNPGELILGHITDAHDWHLWGSHEHPVSIPLPVILYSDKGFDVFMSNKFEHGHATFAGKYNYRLEENHIVAVNNAGEVDEEATKKIFDISITKNVATLLFSAVCLLCIFLSVAARYKKYPSAAPKGLQSFLEPLILFIRDDVAKPNLGNKTDKFLPYLLTVFFFILFNNLLGLIPFAPGGANFTGNIAVTMTLAVFTFVITTINGTKHYWHHVFAMPGVPKPILIILTPIEILGVFLRPFVLMIRLFANITAGHIIALSFFSMIFIFGEMSTGVGLGVAAFSVAFTVFMSLLEVLVAFLQAYVFCLLSAIYFGSAIEEGHH